MSDDELQITTADMLEIVAGGGNGVEYVDVCGLIETAAKELREKDKDISNLREALKPFEAELQAQEEEVPHVTDEAVVFYNYSLCLRHLRLARTILEGTTK